MHRRTFLSCALLPGSVRPGDRPEPTQVRNGRWSGWPPDRCVAGWHALGRSGMSYDEPPDADPDRMWWDPAISAWRFRPGGYEAVDPSDAYRSGWTYRGAAE